MLVIGLTGGIGSGKSTVANIFAEYQVPVIDTDKIAHQLVAPGQAALDEIIQTFGKSILTSNDELDRKKLAAITFNNEKSRIQLEKILHPRIRQEVEKQLSKLNTPYVIIVIPLLTEKGKYDFIDRVLVIDCEESQQINRTLQRDNRSETEINNILRAQASRQERNTIADDIIENTGNMEALRQSVSQLHHYYLDLCKI
ncbi:MAG TPA: dephospho-CoA kinase [Gammaproteobacteria bacterium]